MAAENTADVRSCHGNKLDAGPICSACLPGRAASPAGTHPSTFSPWSLCASMFGFRPMETIVESTASNPNSNPQSPIMAQDREGDREHSLDALLQSLGRPTKDLDLFPLDLPLRSSSTSKMPSRNPSQRVREWMKRSNTVR